MFRLDLDPQRLSALVDKKVGGIPNLMDCWAERFGELPDRSTFYLWKNASNFNGNLVTYLRLCACLDVDPLFLISSRMFESASLGDQLLMLAMHSRPDRRARRGGTGRGIRVDDVMGLFGPLPEWPSSAIVPKIYGCDWTKSFFTNNGQTISRYEALHLKAAQSISPIMIHFAYRVSSSERWRMYGSVEIWRDSNRLVNLYGKNQLTIAMNPGEAIVETRFGEGACEFCLASIHDFTCDPMGEQKLSQSLRFTA